MEQVLGSSLKENLALLRARLRQSADLGEEQLDWGAGTRATLLFMIGLVDMARIQMGIVRPIQSWDGPVPDSLERVAAQVTESPASTVTPQVEKALDLLLRGYALLLVDGREGALLLPVQGGEARPPEEPDNEPSVRGPRDGLVESLITNRALLRRRIRNASLRFEAVILGSESKTMVNLVFLDGAAPQELLGEVRRRIKAIRTDGLLDAGMLEEMVEDNPWSPFPQVLATGRPDRASAALLSGRVVLLVDQSPLALIVPAVFWDFLHVPEDYYERWWAASFIRLLRVTGIFLSLTLPAMWILMVAFHQEMLPTPLALSVAGGREQVPMPVLVETLLMEVTFEFLREAGIRLPRGVGQTVSIVGALVIGQAAVQAGLVSPANVIVVSMTGLASFVSPSYSMAYSFRLLRFALLLVSGAFGLLGFGLVLVLILMHLVAMKSFGVDFLSPVLPYTPGSAREWTYRPSWRWLRHGNKRWWVR